MFKFLKEKLKAAVSRISSAIEKEEPIEVPLPPHIEPEEIFTEQEIEDIEVPPPPVEIIPEKPKETRIEKPKETLRKEEKKAELRQPFVEEKKHFEKPKEAVKEIKKKVAREEPIREIPKKEEPKKEIIHETPKKEVIHEAPKKEVIQEEKKGFFSRLKQAITTTKISPERFDELFWELELAMLENNVAFEVIGKIKADLKNDLVEKPITRGKVEDAVVESLRESISGLFDDYKAVDFVKEAKGKKPYIVSFLGANGSGKTTTIAKMAYMLQKTGLKCVLAAGDTWRSAAIQQLEEHAKRLNVPIVKHDYGADPAAVAFDAVEMAKARNIDVVLIDTAGRQHSNANLMDEMKKIVRVAKPDLKIYIGEMIAGNDCIEQIRSFDQAVGIDAVVLAKADIDEKGGTAISVTYVTKKPILFLGMGQEYKDLEAFDKEKILNSLGL
ncbi:MAG: signal recognition particle-docking protein FtsY [Nanoarchaeota archaeon]|nr:signal recognition particle-docking protein FtsY [Nanoarchaeota archaeon]